MSLAIRSNDVRLAASLHYPVHNIVAEKPHCRWPLIVICQGLASNRIGVDRLFVEAADFWGENGYLTLTFDFAGCGESTGEYGAGGLEDMVAQTRHVLDYAWQLESVDPSRIILLGHGLGGTTAALTAAFDKRIKSLVLWAAIAEPLGDTAGVIPPLRHAGRFAGDVLLLHGMDDIVVPVNQCSLFQVCYWNRSDGKCDKIILPKADHTFSNSGHRRRLYNETVHWLNNLEKQKKDREAWTY
nr:alpha/beta fold hydrolase [Paenibacillus sp. MSJ-34]